MRRKSDVWWCHLEQAVTSPADLPLKYRVNESEMKKVAERYPMRISRHYLSLIRKPGDPIWRQCVPDPAEMDDAFSPDPLDEERLSPVPGLIHRYPDRVVLLVSSTCAVYCRFCMRKRRVGKASETFDLEKACAYIASKPSVRDVVLSGGDPLLLGDEVLDHILASLRSIPHLNVIRIGTRVPVTLPGRITTRLCRILKNYHPLYVNTHFNHPAEITNASSVACNRLADAGIPLGNQTVLLKGVNDDPAVMRELMEALLGIRVKPYYIHQMDLVRGTGHFRTAVSDGLKIVAALRGHVSGMAVPQYVIDLPGGKGKVPVLPDSWRREGDVLWIRNYLGEQCAYPDPLPPRVGAD